MSRTDRYRFTYALAAILASATLVGVGFSSGNESALMCLAILGGMVFVGVKVQHHFWRDHYEARHIFRMRRWKESADLSDSFIKSATEKEWLSHLVWLSYMVTSRDIIAVTENNVASAYMALADYVTAESRLCLALERDPLYPVPHLNKAKILLMLRREDEAKQELEESRRLGFRRYTWRSLCDEVLPYRDGEKTA
jgi:hypothetical protein